MGQAVIYIAAEDESQLSMPVDFTELIQTLEDLEIVDPFKFEQTPRECTRRAGTQTLRLFNPDYGQGCRNTLREIAESWGQAFDGINFFTLKAPVPIPVLTHDYPVFCPHCKKPVDSGFQDSLARYSMESFYEGVERTHAFTCEECQGKVTLGELLEQGELLHRRYYLEIDDACYVSKEVAILSEQGRSLLEGVFQGPLALRHGYLT